MNISPKSIHNVLVSGSIASVLSTLVLALCGRREERHPAAPTNSTSHWLWGDRAIRQNQPTIRYTLVGYLIHHGASIFWASFHEKCFGGRLDRRDNFAYDLSTAAITSALAYYVDFNLTPKRFTPGFERRLSKTALLAIYATFALGLALGRKSRQ